VIGCLLVIYRVQKLQQQRPHNKSINCAEVANI
jgi:hypothetical protein